MSRKQNHQKYPSRDTHGHHEHRVFTQKPAANPRAENNCEDMDTSQGDQRIQGNGHHTNQMHTDGNQHGQTHTPPGNVNGYGNKTNPGFPEQAHHCTSQHHGPMISERTTKPQTQPWDNRQSRPHAASGGSTYPSNYHGQQTPPGLMESTAPHGGMMHGASQLQASQQMFRSLQASKQMVFGVFENVISMLEETEAREETHARRKYMPRSDVDVPDQRRFKDSDIKAKFETQLLLFETQMKCCPQDMREAARGELILSLFRWSAMRAKQGLPLTGTDLYASQLFEVLHKGRTRHPDAFYNPPDISEEGLNDLLPNLAMGQHKMKELDQEFKGDDKKVAKLRPIRNGGSIMDGIARLQEVRPDLQPDLDTYVAKHVQMDLR